MARRHPPPLAVIVCALALGACATPDRGVVDPGAVQLVAATAVTTSIASNPGSIVMICVDYAGDWERPALTSVDASAPAIASLDGCVEREGRVVAADGGGQGVSVTVGAPEWSDGLRSAVSVLTSTGVDDLAAYTCAVRREDGAWRSEGCELDAIS